MEEWRDIPGYEGEYQVSDMGQVLGQRGQVLRFGVHDNRGSKNGMSRLTEADIPAIRARIATGEFLKHIAVDYGVTREAISSVKHRKNWGSV